MSTAEHIGRSPAYSARLAFALGCLFMMLICFPGLAELPGGVPLSTAVLFASLPFWFVAAATRQALVLDRVAATAAGVIMSSLALLIVWAFLSALDAAMPLRSGRNIVTLASAFAIFFLIMGTITRARLEVCVSLLCFTLAVTCLLSLVAYFEPFLWAMIFTGDRASGFFKNPNQFGMAISTLLPLAMAAMLAHRGRRRRWVVCVVALLLGLVLSGSKMNLMVSSATVPFIVFCYVVIAYSGRLRALMLALGAFASALFFGAAYILLSIFNPRVLLLFQQLAADDEELHSLSTRTELWQKSMEQFFADPIFGAGAGQPLNVLYKNETVAHSHNVILDYLRTMGVPGLCGILIILATVLFLSASSIRLAFVSERSSILDRMLCIGLATGSMAYIAANLSSDLMGPSTSPFFWMVVFLTMTARLSLASRHGPAVRGVRAV